MKRIAHTGASWRYLPPKVQGNTLRAIWGKSADAIWACGAHGALVHWNGDSWRQLKTPLRVNLYTVWARDAEHVWVGGDNGLIMHWDGRKWWRPDREVIHEACEVKSIVGDDSGVWALFRDRDAMWPDYRLARYDGKDWHRRESHPHKSLERLLVDERSRLHALDLTALYRVTDDDVQLVSGLAAVYRPDHRHTRSRRDRVSAARWQSGQLDLLGSFGLRVRIGRGRPICLDRGTDCPSDLLRDEPRKNPREFGGGFVAPTGEAWLVGADIRYHDGTPCSDPGATGWRSVYHSEHQLHAVWGPTADCIWAVGENGTIVHWDGRRWHDNNQTPRITLAAAMVLDDQRMALLGHRMRADPWTALVRRGERWPVTEQGDGWLGFTGEPWSRVAVHVVSPDLVWLDGGTKVGRWDGREWRIWREREPAIHDSLIWACAPDDAWRVVSHEDVEHWNGHSWHRMHVAGIDQITAIFGIDADEVWLGSKGGDLVRWDGTSWKVLASFGGPLSYDYQPIHHLHGHRRDHIWAVSDSGSSFRWNGTEWRDMGKMPLRDVAEGDRAQVVLARSEDEVWAGGFYGTLWRHDGQKWHIDNLANHSRIETLFADGAGGIWAAGRDGVILYRAPPDTERTS